VCKAFGTDALLQQLYSGSFLQRKIITRRRLCHSNAKNVNVKVAIGSRSHCLSSAGRCSFQQFSDRSSGWTINKTRRSFNGTFLTKLWNVYLKRQIQN